MAEKFSHKLVVRDKPAFLHRMMIELGGNAQISLEGDLTSCRFAHNLILTGDETRLLKRNTLAPKQDFLVLRLTPETVDTLFKQIMEAGLKRAIIHVQIERDGVLELGAYDNFHSESVVCGPAISSALLNELKNTNVLCDFHQAAKNQKR